MMWLQMALDRFLEQQPYYPCCLLVSRDIAVLTQAALEVRRCYAWPMVSLEEIVCEPLVSQPVAKRPAYVPGLIERALQEYATGPVLCTDTDVLFDPSLQLDPLSFFKRTSRFLSLVITWAGAFEHGKLSYAVPGHAHYRTWPTPDLCTDCIIQLDAFHN